jgi:very-short-patch-repair endonuclease
MRLVIDIVPAQESEQAARARTEKRAWLADRGYVVHAVAAASIARDMTEVLDTLALALGKQPSQ